MCVVFVVLTCEVCDVKWQYVIEVRCIGLRSFRVLQATMVNGAVALKAGTRFRP